MGNCCQDMCQGEPAEEYCGCQCPGYYCRPEHCCDSIRVTFQCGSRQSSCPDYPQGCTCSTGGGFRLRNQFAEMPDFSDDPIMSEDGEFVFALSNACSIPCQNVMVSVYCVNDNTGCCCLEVLGGGGTPVLFVSGAGYVTASIVEGEPYERCGTFTIKLNGQPAPLYIADCTELSVTVESDNTDCTCCAVSAAGVDCGISGFRGVLFTRGEERNLKINTNVLIGRIKSRIKKIKHNIKKGLTS